MNADNAYKPSLGLCNPQKSVFTSLILSNSNAAACLKGRYFTFFVAGADYLIANPAKNLWISGYFAVNSEGLRATQAPIKELCRARRDAALITLKAEGHLGEGNTCSVQTGKALVEAGLYPATGGTGLSACSGDMLLEVLLFSQSGVGCGTVFKFDLASGRETVLYRFKGGRDGAAPSDGVIYVNGGLYGVTPYGGGDGCGGRGCGTVFELKP